MARFIDLFDAAQALTGKDDDETFDFWLELLARQVEDGTLHGVVPDGCRPFPGDTWYAKRRVVVYWKVPVVAFDAWRRQHGYEVATPAPVPAAPATPAPIPPGKGGRRQQQIAAILAAVRGLNYDPLSIPRGGKGEIEGICLGDAQLFTSGNSFEHAWKAARAGGQVRVENHEMYARGK